MKLINLFRLTTSLVAMLSFSSLVFAQAKDEALLAAAAADQTNVLKTLERLVSIETGSANVEGLNALGALLSKELEAMGAQVTRHKSTANSGAENIVGKLTGKGKSKFLMMAHMDTVYPKGMIEKAPFKVDGDKAYGLGIADAKGGIAVILHTLKLLKARGADTYGSVTVLFNTDEEIGSVGSSDLITALSKEVDYVLSYEPNVAQRELLILATSGSAAFNVSITGKAAHAGTEPENGINALTEAADFVLRTQDIDDKASDLRFNWTLSSAGKVHNVIPESAELSANFRYASPDQLERVHARLKELAQKPKLAGAKIAVSMVIGRPAFIAGAEGRKLIDKAIAIYKEIDFPISILPRTGGGTDAAYAGLAGKPILEGLGLPGFGYHSNNAEYVLVSSIARRLYLSARLLGDLSSAR
jgi:glutamate carboxypeptidase